MCECVAGGTGQSVAGTASMMMRAAAGMLGWDGILAVDSGSGTARKMFMLALLVIQDQFRVQQWAVSEPCGKISNASGLAHASGLGRPAGHIAMRPGSPCRIIRGLEAEAGGDGDEVVTQGGPRAHAGLRITRQHMQHTGHGRVEGQRSSVGQKCHPTTHAACGPDSLQPGLLNTCARPREMKAFPAQTYVTCQSCRSP